jgi:GNAT superfamily N-acetyltransferase
VPHFQARIDSECVGAIVCKLDFHKKIVKRGYIAMLAVDSRHRKKKIGSTLVKKAIQAMIAEEADEVRRYLPMCGGWSGLLHFAVDIESPKLFFVCYISNSKPYIVEIVLHDLFSSIWILRKKI